MTASDRARRFPVGFFLAAYYEVARGVAARRPHLSRPVCWRPVCLFFLGSAAAVGFAQPAGLCFAYLRQGDIVVACDDRETRVTQRGDIGQFAVDGVRPAVGFVTERIVSRAAAEVADTATIVDLV